MTTKKYLWIVFMALICFTHQAYNQPFYFYHGSTDGVNFWRLNLQSGVKDIFHSDSVNKYGDASWDPSQHWAFIFTDNSYLGRSLFDSGKYDYYVLVKAINVNDPSIIHSFPNQYPHPFGTTPNSFFDGSSRRGQVVDGIVYNPNKNVFYVSWCLPHPDSLTGWAYLPPYQRTAVFDAATFAVLDTLPVPPGWINSLSSVSDDGNYLYVESCDFWKNRTDSIGKYSLLSKQLIIN